MPEPVEKESTRWLVTREDGARSLTVLETVMYPGAEGRLHTHPTDQVIMVLDGSVQMIVGNEIRTVRAGSTMLAPPGVPHNLINNTWIPARLLVIHPTDNLETTFLE
jgi:quercetin dioxygenase-like cupin family protein